MDNLVRTDTVFGKRANIVGNISADLVLESLGKIYIKSRNSSKTLEEVIKAVVSEDVESSASATLITEGLENIDIASLKEGQFIYDKLSNILYLWLDDDFVELINVAPDGTGYVKRSGDTMTGRLTINVPNGAPMHVNSSVLVKNFNANYLQGETADSFTRRQRDENITGKWTFQSPAKFQSNTLFAQDIIVNGSVGSSSFASGFGGYGWRMDADTNTLTIDNLVVRKLMRVYEMIVNRISATNGSLWVTNAGKVVEAYKLSIYNANFFDLSSNTYQVFLSDLCNGDCFIKLESLSETNYGQDAFMYPDGNSNVRNYFTNTTLKMARVIRITNDLNLNTTFPFGNNEGTTYTEEYLFSADFKPEKVFPIVTRPDYAIYQLSKEYQKQCEEEIKLKKDNENYPNFDENTCRQTWLNNFITAVHDNYGKTVSGYITNIRSLITLTRPYYKYFGKDCDFYLVNFDDNQLPVFKPGDLLRCQKWTHQGIKYYDAIVCNVLSDYAYIIQVANSILDQTTYINYDDNLNPTTTTIVGDKINMTLYEQTYKYESPEDKLYLDAYGNLITPTEEQKKEYLRKKLLGIVEPEDSLVQMGNLWDAQRQNAVYITSTDDGAPFNDVLSELNRPDFSVIYYIPTYKTIKLYKSAAKEAGTIDVPYTGYYYIQPSRDNGENEADYALLGNKLYKASSYSINQEPIWLTQNPNGVTSLYESQSLYKILTEDKNFILLEDDSGFILTEEIEEKLKITSTKTTKARFGNLEGIIDNSFPIEKQPYGYGLYGQNVFLTGEFYLNNGKSVAEIGEDAIYFAMASTNALSNSMDILERDLKLANQVIQKNMQNNYITKGDLDSAGIRIVKDTDGSVLGISIWGNAILIATTQKELEGEIIPSALFNNGRIQGKFLQIYGMHSAIGFGDIINVVQNEYSITTQSGIEQKYYIEQQVYTKQLNGEMVYYYVDKINQEEKIISEYNPLFGNTLYGWNLEATGEGYLAGGNVEWDQNGKLTIKGDVVIGGANGIHILDSQNNNVLNINGREVNSLSNWVGGTSTSTIYFENSYTNVTTTINVSGDTYKDGRYYTDSTFDSSTILGVIKTINQVYSEVNIQIYSDYYYLINTDARPPLDPNPLFIVLNYDDNTRKIYKLISGVNTTIPVGSSETVISFNICIINNYAQLFQGSLSYSSLNLVSEIGANFIGMKGGNTILWFGSKGLRVGGVKNETTRYSHSGLAVDSRGALLIRETSEASNISELARRLDVEETNTSSRGVVDLLYSIDDTYDCKYFDPEDRVGSFIVERDVNSHDNYWNVYTTEINGTTYINYYIMPEIGGSKIYIIKPSELCPIRCTILNSAAGLRIGRIIIIQMDIMGLGTSVDTAMQPITVIPNKEIVRDDYGNELYSILGRIYKYNYVASYPVEYKDVNNGSNLDYGGLQLKQSPMILMYMGEKTFEENNTVKHFYVWKSLTPDY